MEWAVGSSGVGYAGVMSIMIGVDCGVRCWIAVIEQSGWNLDDDT